MTAAAKGMQTLPKLMVWDANRLKWFLIGAIVVVMGVHLFSLTIYPQAFIDEGWLANRAWNWLNTGVNFDSIHVGVLDQFGYEWSVNYFIGQMPYLLVYRLLGVGLFQTRLVAWVFGAALLWLTTAVGRRLFSLNTGLVAALLLALSLPFAESSRIRQDIILATVIMLSVWLALYALERNKLWAHFLAGLVLTLGFDVHQTAIVFIPPLAALYIAYYGRGVFFKRGTWLVGLGGALGLAYYVVSHVLPSSEAYSRLMSFYFAADADARIPLFNPDIILESAVREVARYRFRSQLPDLVLIALGGLLLLRRRSKADALLLTFTISAFASFILLSSNKTPLYAINLYPFFMLVIAAGLMSVVQARQPKNLTRIAGVLLVLFTGYGVYETAVRINANRAYDYYAITDPIREIIPADQRVMGMPTWWFGFPEYDYRSSLSLSYYRFFNDYDVRQALEVMRPDYIIVDSTQQVVLVDEGQTLPQGMNVYRVSRPEFEAFLQAQAELVLEFSNPWHGDFRIYRVNWDA